MADRTGATGSPREVAGRSVTPDPLDLGWKNDTPLLKTATPPPLPERTRSRKSALTTVQHYRLNEACQVVRRAFDGHGPYLVGTVIGGADYRDVDVRTILPDDEYDALFGERERLWDLVCLSVSQYLSDATGLPVDFQVQRMTEANDKHDGPRNALGLNVDRRYAGGGDATPVTAPARDLS